jgi:hypothetical protein
VKGESEELLAKLRLLFERELVQSLAYLKLLAEEEVDLPLLWLGFLSYGPPWAHYLGGYQDRLLGGPLGLPGLRYTAPDGVEHKDYGGEVLG